MILAINDLRIVELSCLIFHEAHDPAHLARVRAEIADEAVQRNPVIVAPYRDRCLLLDGVHRTRALNKLGCRFALVQLVELPERVGSWSHLLDDLGLEEAIQSVEQVEVSEAEPERGYLAAAGFSGGEKPEHGKRGSCRQFVSCGRCGRCTARVAWCAGWTPIDPSGWRLGRQCSSTVAARPQSLQRSSRRGSAARGRHPLRRRSTCPERSLPARASREGEPAARNAELREFVRRTWQGGRVRYYAEPVILFE
jgi:L-serine kinase (ATP) / ParB family transcriptional regulator, heme-responsive regulator